MAKMLDFNSFVQPELPITFADANKTIVHVTAPSVDLIDQLEANLDALRELAKNTNKETVAACYDLAAKLISCNTECLTITGADLRGKYGVSIVMLIAFYSGYLEFIEDIKNAKN